MIAQAGPALRTFVRKWSTDIPPPPEVALAVDAEVLLGLPEADAVGTAGAVDLLELKVVVLPAAHGADGVRAGRRLGQCEKAAARTRVAARTRRHAAVSYWRVTDSMSLFEPVPGVGHKLTEAL